MYNIEHDCEWGFCEEGLLEQRIYWTRNRVRRNDGSTVQEVKELEILRREDSGMAW